MPRTSGGAGAVLLARVQYAPSSVATYSLVGAGIGVTALDSTNLKVTFTAPSSGAVLVTMQGFVQGSTGAGASTNFAMVSSTASPGTLVGLVGLMNLTPTATTADNGVICDYTQLITGLVAGTSYTWYFAASYTGTLTKVLAQGGTTNNTQPTAAPALIVVFAA